jgi:hypothetical protein
VKYSISLLCIASSAAGCAFAPAGLSAQESLAAPISVSGAGGSGSLTFTLADGFAAPTATVMQVARPTLKLHSTGARAELDSLSLPLGDVDVPATALPPHGLQLRNLVLTAGPERVAIMHAEDDAIELQAEVPLQLDWSAVLEDGTLYRLGAVPTDPVALDVHVFRAAGKTTATVHASCAGTCWAIDGVARLSDGALDVEADAEVTDSR